MGRALGGAVVAAAARAVDSVGAGVGVIVGADSAGGAGRAVTWRSALVDPPRRYTLSLIL